MMARTIFFEKQGTFTEQASALPSGIINTDQPGIPGLLRNYEYPVCVWPVVIDPETAATLATLCVTLPKLLRQIPSLYFGDDIKKIAEFYFEGNKMVAEFALLCHQKNTEVGSRLDLTLTSEGFKVLEVNIGSSIGGWQVHSFESIIRDLHRPLKDPATADCYLSRNTQEIYISFLVDQIIGYVRPAGSEINVFIEVGDLGDERYKAHISEFLNLLLQNELKKRGLTGGAFVGSATMLHLGNDGDVLMGSRTIHGILVFNSDGRRVSSLLLRSFIMGKIYFPDHIGLTILKHKANLAILRHLAEKGLFSAEENALILRHIPWTCFAERKEVSFQNESCQLSDLLHRNKDRFVLKAATGFQGKDVFVGKFLSQEEWEQAIALAMSTKSFIAQEFSESEDFLAPGENQNWLPHKLIWGAFGYGDSYGGVWVRMSSVKTGSGVINSATGAVESIVFESC